MRYRNYLKKTLNGIAVLTFIVGTTQIIFPAFVLYIIGSEVNYSGEYLFRIVGMFMALMGGMIYHSVNSKRNQPVAVLWAAFQKLGATIAVFIGILVGVFSYLALGVVAFDAFSAVLLFMFLNSLKQK